MTEFESTAVVDRKPPSALKALMLRRTGRLTRLIAASHGTHRGLIRRLLGNAEYVVGRLDQFLHPDLDTMRRLVFDTLGNINRSAFAEAVAAAAGIKAASIGLSTATGNSCISSVPTFVGLTLTSY